MGHPHCFAEPPNNLFPMVIHEAFCGCSTWTGPETHTKGGIRKAANCCSAEEQGKISPRGQDLTHKLIIMVNAGLKFIMLVVSSPSGR